MTKLKKFLSSHLGQQVVRVLRVFAFNFVALTAATGLASDRKAVIAAAVAAAEATIRQIFKVTPS